MATRSKGTHSVIVAVPSGYQALTYDASGHVDFWLNAAPATDWTHSTSNTYPYEHSLDPSGPTSGTGQVLRNMTDATFILYGTFTTDGSANAIAYTRGAGSFSVIAARADGNLAPTGTQYRAGDLGPSYNLYFIFGVLQTADCPTNLPLYKCNAADAVLKRWQWNGTEFARG